jgi:predicted dehydrogenase
MPLKIAIIGCGAIADLYYSPVLRLLEEAGQVHVAVLFDPNARQSLKLKTAFPEASVVSDFAQISSLGIDLAIVASPPRFHSDQTIKLLGYGIGVLCEKPIAATIAEAEQMVQAAKQIREDSCSRAVSPLFSSQPDDKRNNAELDLSVR